LFVIGVFMSRQNGLASSLILIGLISVCAVAQQTRGRRVTVNHRAAVRAAANPSPAASPTPSGSAVQVINSGTPAEYLSGEVNVSVKGNQNPIIRLGLAQNGVNIIEFPAADSFFMIHPGNSDLVAVDQETAEKSLRTLALRPGASFIAPAPGAQTRAPSASISVQMQSGLVVTFLIYPVRDLSQNAHRCVVMYNRDEVVASRRAAGLAVNLNGKDPQPPKPAPGAIRFGEYPEPAGGTQPVMMSGKKPAGVVVDVNSTKADERARTGNTSKKRSKPAEAANHALKDVLKAPAKVGEFSKPVHGLSMAVSTAADLDAETRLVTVAVRNESKGDLRMVSGNPELYVQTFDEQGKSVQMEPVKKLHVETTSVDGKIVGGGVAYYSIVYESPVMGARQRLRVSVSQTDAADEPATTALGDGAKRN
jgi:hypothetical protein